MEGAKQSNSSVDVPSLSGTSGPHCSTILAKSGKLDVSAAQKSCIASALFDLSSSYRGSEHILHVDSAAPILLPACTRKHHTDEHVVNVEQAST
jgi:hypothetical protein